MKKVWVAFIAILFISVMASCSSANNEISALPKNANSIATVKYGNSDLTNGNMQKNVPSGNFVPVEGKVVFLCDDILQDKINLMTFDPLTGSVSTFCKDATCSHLSDTCATAGVNSNLESVDGEVYGLNDANGTVMKLKNDRFEPILDGGVSHFFHCGKDLFVATTDSSLMVFEDDTPQKSHTIIEEYTGYWEAICDGYLYYQYSGVHRLDLSQANAEPETVISGTVDYITDGNNLYYAKATDGFLYRCQMDGSDLEQLTDRPVLPASWNFDDEYFYFRYYLDNDLSGAEAQNIYRLSKKVPSQPEKLAELPSPVFQIFLTPDSEKMFVTGVDKKVYAVSKTGTEVNSLVW